MDGTEEFWGEKFQLSNKLNDGIVGDRRFLDWDTKESTDAFISSRTVFKEIIRRRPI